MAEDINLSGVDPLRRAEMLRRVAAVRRYLEIASPTHEDDERHSAELRMGVAQFLNLVRAWREHGRASAMPGARLSNPVRRRGHSIDPEVEKVIADELERSGISVRPAELHRAVVAACVAKGVPAPLADLVKARLFSARARTAPARDARKIVVVDHVALALPVLTSSDEIVVPVLSFVADGGNGRILGHAMALRPPSPQAAARALIAALQGPAFDLEEPAWPLEMASDATIGWKGLLEILKSSGVQRNGRSAAPVPSGKHARMLFGTGIASIRLRPRLVHAPAQVAIQTLRGVGRPLSLAQAHDAVEAAIASHNEGREPRAFALADARRRNDLLAGLRTIATAPDEKARHRRRS